MKYDISELELNEQEYGYKFPEISGSNEIHRITDKGGMGWTTLHWEPTHKKVYELYTWVIPDASGEDIDHEFEFTNVYSRIDQLPELNYGYEKVQYTDDEPYSMKDYYKDNPIM